MRTFNINRIVANNDNKFFLIAGPCQIESQDHAENTAGQIKEICDELDIDLIYKSSFDKANRSSVNTQRGLGIDEGLQILNSIKHEFGIPVLTDIMKLTKQKYVPMLALMCYRFLRSYVDRLTFYLRLVLLVVRLMLKKGSS